MKRIYLLRHAKSSRDDPGLDDHHRPLAPRGRKACPVIAGYFGERYGAPDLVLCSTSVRTRQTLERVMGHLGAAWPAKFERGLYLASAGGLIKRLARLDEAVGTVMLIGHNPGMERLAARLTDDGRQPGSNAGKAEHMRAKFPTAALAVLEFDDGWATLAPGSCRLIDFVAPRELAD